MLFIKNVSYAIIKKSLLSHLFQQVKMFQNLISLNEAKSFLSIQSNLKDIFRYFLKITSNVDILHFYWVYTAQKMTFSIKDFFSKCAQIGRKLWIWSHVLKKSLMKNFIFCAVLVIQTRFHFSKIATLLLKKPLKTDLGSEIDKLVLR